MTDEQLEYSLRTKKLKLSGNSKFSYYIVTLFWFFFPAFFIAAEIVDIFRGKPLGFITMKWFIIIPSLIGVLFYFFQRSKLKFKSVKTRLRRGELDAIIKNVAEELHWDQFVVGEKIIIAKTHFGFLESNGEHITILFDEDQVLVKSIIDLDKRTAITSLGRNNRNERKLIEAIRNASS